jgi:3-oxoacyl-[acyl-carrier protein] reductase
MPAKMSPNIHATRSRQPSGPLTGPLAGQVSLITGASRGIGLAIALRLARLGSAVAICGRDAAALKNAEARLRETGAPVFSCPADVRQSAAVEQLVRQSEKALGPLSVLVNNAGVGLFGPAHERSEQDWDRVLDTNLKSVFLVSRAALPGMIARRAGHIINISSLAGKNTFAGAALYCASKWGLQGLSGCMAEDLRDYGIRVSLICPGSAATGFSHSSKKDPAKLLQPEDVAHVVEMLLTQGPQSFVSEVQMRPLRKP